MCMGFVLYSNIVQCSQYHFFVLNCGSVLFVSASIINYSNHPLQEQQTSTTRWKMSIQWEMNTNLFVSYKKITCFSLLSGLNGMQSSPESKTTLQLYLCCAPIYCMAFIFHATFKYFAKNDQASNNHRGANA